MGSLAVIERCKRCGDILKRDRKKCQSCGFWAVPVVHVEEGDGTVLLSDASILDVKRITTGPWDKCFGGGIVLTSVILLGGAPGAGKSTMSLQLADVICKLQNREICYIAAEETKAEIRERARRLGLRNMNKIRMIPVKDGYNGNIGTTIMTRKPCAVIVDSLPGFTDDPEEAVRLCKAFKDYAIELNGPILVIDHVTKSDDFAGLMKLQHAVDGLFTLYPRIKGDADGKRVMKTIKNRFGANEEVCLDMTEKGLRACPGCEDCEEEEEEDEEDEED